MKHQLPTEEAIPALAEALAYYDISDVERWFERSRSMVGHDPLVTHQTIRDVRAFQKVPNEPFRKAWEPFAAQTVVGLRDEKPEWVGLFRAELERTRALPEALDSSTKKLGPGNLGMGEISNYLRRVLGVTTSSGGESVAWLLDYEMAAVLCRVFGLEPYTVGI